MKPRPFIHIYVFSLEMIALAYSLLVAFPPKSPVSVLPSARVAMIALLILSAYLLSPMCCSIIMDERRSAVGLALSCPAMSGADPENTY